MNASCREDRGERNRCEFRNLLRDRGCIDFAHLLVALIRVGHIHLTHQTHLAFAARIRVGGIGLSVEILSRGTFSDFILAY